MPVLNVDRVCSRRLLNNHRIYTARITSMEVCLARPWVRCTLGDLYRSRMPSRGISQMRRIRYMPVSVLDILVSRVSTFSVRYPTCDYADIPRKWFERPMAIHPCTHEKLHCLVIRFKSIRRSPIPFSTSDDRRGRTTNSSIHMGIQPPIHPLYRHINKCDASIHPRRL